MPETPLPQHMWTVSPAGYAALKKDEGLRLKAYDDGAGNRTIGYGHVIRASGPSVITQDQADALLRSDCTKALHVIRHVVSAKLFQCQVDALVRLVFNIGGAAFTSSHLLAAINRHDAAEVARQWMRWNHAGGKVSTGLTRRRKRELAMWQEVPF